jgi:hypothetical protein
MRLVGLLLVVACGLAGASTGLGAGTVTVVEDWSEISPGATGVPAGWRKYETPGGRPRYDFAVEQEGGLRALRLRSQDEHSTIAKEVRVDLAATPILEWTWKVVKLPDGADIRQRGTSDLTAYVLVAWPRPPAILRTRLIGYVWDGVLPAGAMERSRKSGQVTFFVVRSGRADLGRFVTERRNVVDDYVRAFGEAPPNPGAVAISIDTNDTSSTAEGLIGRIAFLPAPPRR